jgi:hypothetical protein
MCGSRRRRHRARHGLGTGGNRQGRQRRGSWPLHWAGRRRLCGKSNGKQGLAHQSMRAGQCRRALLCCAAKLARGARRVKQEVRRGSSLQRGATGPALECRGQAVHAVSAKQRQQARKAEGGKTGGVRQAFDAPGKPRWASEGENRKAGGRWIEARARPTRQHRVLACTGGARRGKKNISTGR